MRKVLAILMAAVICISMCACAPAETEAPTTSNRKTIELTTSNYRDYFFVEVETRNYKCEKKSLLGTYYEKASADCYVTVSPKVPCEIYNVTMTFSISGAGYFWENKDITVNVPSTGSVTKSVTVTAEAPTTGLLVQPEFSLLFAVISGQIVVEE